MTERCRYGCPLKNGRHMNRGDLLLCAERGWAAADRAETRMSKLGGIRTRLLRLCREVWPYIGYGAYVPDLKQKAEKAFAEIAGFPIWDDRANALGAEGAGDGEG